jgi:putative membrane protein
MTDTSGTGPGGPANRGPVVIDLDAATPPPDPAAAPPVPEPDLPPQGVAMQGALTLAGGQGSTLGRWVGGAALGLFGLWLGLAAWDWALALTARVPLLGWLAWGLIALVALGVVVAVLRELIGWRRLRRLDSLRARSEAALAAGDLGAAQAVSAALATLYGGPAEGADLLDPDAVIDAAERRWLTAPDAAARAEVQSAARQVALITAMVPLALADVAAALIVNLRMVRRIAAIYGGRPGMLGSWRLIRAVAAHLAATGMVAVGDDMIGHALGGGLVSKLSRRFGEGVVNGALTARVGVSAMAVCRPLPWRSLPRPGVAALAANALRGVFQRS